MTDWKGGELPFLCLLLTVCVVVFIFLVAQQIRELSFYWSNGWDFSQDSNISLSNYYRGEGSDAQDLMSNKERVLFGRPVVILLAAIFSIALASIVFHPERWRRELGGSELTYYSLGSQPHAI